MARPPLLPTCSIVNRTTKRRKIEAEARAVAFGWGWAMAHEEVGASQQRWHAARRGWCVLDKAEHLDGVAWRHRLPLE